MAEGRKGFGYVSVMIGLILAITLSALTYKGLSKILTIQKSTQLKRNYDIVIQNEVVKTYNKKWSSLENGKIILPANDSEINVSFNYKEGSKINGITDKLTIDFEPEDQRLNKLTFNLEKFPET